MKFNFKFIKNPVFKLWEFNENAVECLYNKNGGIWVNRNENLIDREDFE